MSENDSLHAIYKTLEPGGHASLDKLRTLC